MNNRIILTDKIAELLAPDGYQPKPTNYLASSATVTHRSEIVLQKINEQVAAFSSGHTTALRQLKEKEYVVGKLKSTLIGDAPKQQHSTYLLNRIDAMATKISKNSANNGPVS